MTVSKKAYIGEPRDLVKHYHGNQLNYVSWDHHLLFAAPFLLCVSPDIKFKDFVETMLVPLLRHDPDAGSISWDTVQWRNGKQSFSPDFDKTLAENGIAHKHQLRFHTPGLNSLLPTN